MQAHITLRVAIKKPQEKKPEPVATKQVQQMFGNAPVKTTGLVNNNVKTVSGGSGSGGGGINITTGNSPQSSGSVLGNSYTSRTSSINTSLTNFLPKTVDLSISSGILGPIGGGFGIQANTKGFAPYVSGGFVTPGKGVAVLFSNNEIKPNSDTMSLSGTAIGATSWSWPLDPEDRFVKFSEMDKAGGVGFPAGASYTINHTGEFTEWSTLFKGGLSGIIFNNR